MKRQNQRAIPCIFGIVLALAAGAPVRAQSAPQASSPKEPARSSAAATYEEPSWMQARRSEERLQAAWRAQVRAATAQRVASQSKAVKRSPPDGDFLPAGGGAQLRTFANPVVVMPHTYEPEVQALRLQAAEDAADRARLKKAIAQQRGRRAGDGRDARNRLQEAQQSRRQDESQLEAAQQSRRQDEARLEAAQQSRRQDEARLEAAQQSRRADQSRLEAAAAERRRQH